MKMENNKEEIYRKEGLVIKQGSKKEIKEMLRVESESWPEEIQFKEEHFKSHLKIFPKGFFCAYVNGTMAGTCISSILNYDLNNPIPSWEEASADGFITNHNPNGNALYVVSLGVSKDFRGLKIGSRLIEKQKELTKELGLDFLVLGARIPFYHKYTSIDVEEYIEKRNENGERFEPELRFYERAGLKLLKIMPNYMTSWDDRESRNYGVILVWENPKARF